MWGALENLLRRARLRGLTEGKVQTARAESLEGDAKDAAERWQDYGFAANPVDGQGLVIHAGGHTIVLRMDRIAERPQLAAYEVSIWHKEGHHATLRSGGVIDVECTTLNMAATTVNVVATAVNITAATTAISGNLTVGGTVVATGNVTGAGKSLATHTHTNVQTGSGTSGPPT
jgi:phage baseplate assembly protein V